MKTLVIASSTYLGNTMKVAQAIAEELDATILSPSEVDSEDISGYDLIGLGSGVKFGSHDKDILRTAQNILQKGKCVFIFSTRCRPLLLGYHSRLKAIVHGKGGILLGEYSCPGLDRTGPWVIINGYNAGRPNGKDIAKARIFAMNMRKRYLSQHNNSGSGNRIAGNRVLLNLTTCIRCGKCVRNCPTQIFVMYDDGKGKYVLPMDEHNCIMCGTCERGCPSDSVFVKEKALYGLRVLLRESKLARIYWNNFKQDDPELLKTEKKEENPGLHKIITIDRGRKR